MSRSVGVIYPVDAADEAAMARLQVCMLFCCSMIFSFVHCCQEREVSSLLDRLTNMTMLDAAPTPTTSRLL